MPEPLKNIYSTHFIEQLISAINKKFEAFDSNEFKSKVFDHNWKNRELKDRMNHITICMQEYLPNKYESALKIILKIAPEFNGFSAMIFPHFVQLYGLNDFEISVKALEELTQYSSSEFAVRPFILKYQKQMMKEMLGWSKHKNEHVRRLASEGCRPKLPWAIALNDFRKDPSPILPILENLKNDSSEYVRRSVANNINDISKDHPDIALSLAKKWQNQSANTDKIIKHALRTLLKKGHSSTLKIFGYGNTNSLKISLLKISKQTVKIGDAFKLAFDITAIKNSNEKVRIEYVIYFIKQNQTHTRKVFKISEAPIADTKSIQKSHSFKNLSTRKHHKGVHYVALQINGIEQNKIKFELI